MAMSDKNRQLVTVIVLLGVLLTAGSVYFYFMMAKPAIESAEKSTEATKKKIADMEAEKAKIKAFLADRSKIEELAKTVDRAKQRLPNNTQEAEEQGFYKIVEDSLRRTGASMSRLAPKEPINRNLYFEIPYEIKGAARYHEFGQLLNVIECNPARLMRVSTFAIKNDAKRPSIHPIDLTVKTYTFNDMAKPRS